MALDLRLGSLRHALRHPLRLQTLAVVLAGVGVLLVSEAILFSERVAALRELRATGPNWSFPSRVYSDGVPLVVGRSAPDAYLLAELEARGYREVRGPAAAPGTYSRERGRWSIVLRGFPEAMDPEGGGGPERVGVRIQAGRIAAVERAGGIDGAFPPDTTHVPRLEPVLVSMLFDEDRTWRVHTSLERVPEPVRQAIVLSEDRRFFTHIGIDVRGALRALEVNVRKGRTRQGGSTITQQLARGLFLGRERTLARKLAEAPLALGLEVLLPKPQIFEMYLNSVYWGQAGGFAVGGIAAAGRCYFDTPVESLTVLQGATLAAMIPAPNLLNPFKDPERVRRRRNAVLRALEQAGQLPRAEAARLTAAPLGLRRGRAPTERFPSYASYVREALDGTLPRHAATHFGLSIFTTMDLAWQELAEVEMSRRLTGLGQNLEGALVVMEPDHATVLAMVGGRNVKTGDFNRAFQARRQTGSAFKPIVYAAALAGGMTPGTVVADTRVTYGEGDSTWTPRNLDGKYHPKVTLAKALEMSLNLATTAVVARVGPTRIAQIASHFGLRGMKPVMSIGLGSNETSLLELTNAFSVFASRGRLRRCSPLRVAVDRWGREVARPSRQATQAIRPDIAALMTGLLQNVTRYGVAYALRSEFAFGRPVAGKTGTSNDYHDAWFVGYPPEVVAGVWVGHDRPESIGREASHVALPIWAHVMGRMLEGFPVTPFASDDELAWVPMDPWRGCLASAGMRAEWTPFLRGTAPTGFCAPDARYAYAAADSGARELDPAVATEPRDTTSARADTLEALPEDQLPR